MPERVSVVVCAHDDGRWGELLKALESLKRQSLPPHEVIVVVDHNETLLERARRELPVRVIPNTQIRGLGGARNSGMAVSTGSIVAFLDDDAVASPQWLSVLAESYADPLVAGAGGSAEAAWEDDRPAWFPREFDWVIGCSYLGMPEHREEVRNVFGCNMSFRREILDALDGFRLGYGCDETDFCIRLHQRWPEKKVVYVPEALIHHHVPRSRASLRRFISRCYFEGGSKAVVARLVGRDDALESESRYARVVVPRGIERSLQEFVRARDWQALARAGALVAGVASAGAGYTAGSLFTAKAAKIRGWSGGEFPATRPAAVFRRRGAS